MRIEAFFFRQFDTYTSQVSCLVDVKTGEIKTTEREVLFENSINQFITIGNHVLNVTQHSEFELFVQNPERIIPFTLLVLESINCS